MFHYNGRPISKQEMTDMLADRHAAVDLAKKQRQREKDAEAAKLIRRDLILICALIVSLGAALGTVLL